MESSLCLLIYASSASLLLIFNNEHPYSRIQIQQRTDLYSILTNIIFENFFKKKYEKKKKLYAKIKQNPWI